MISFSIRLDTFSIFVLLIKYKTFCSRNIGLVWFQVFENFFFVMKNKENKEKKFDSHFLLF